MMNFHGGDDGSISWMQERLNFLEKQHQLWRKQYEEEERRMKQEYEEKLAEIDEATARAAKELELEYAAKKEAIISQFKPAPVHQHATDPHIVHSQPKPLLATAAVMQDVELKLPNPPNQLSVPSSHPKLRVSVVDAESIEGCQREDDEAISCSRIARYLPGEWRNSGLDLQNETSQNALFGNDCFEDIHPPAQMRHTPRHRHGMLLPHNSSTRRDLRDLDSVDLRHDGKTQDALLDDNRVVDTYSSGEGVLLSILTVFDPGGTAPE